MSEGIEPRTDARTLRLLAAASATSVAALGAVFPYLALTLERAGVTPVLVAVLLGAGPFFRLLFGPVSGWIADRFRAEAGVLRWAAGLAALGTMLVMVGGPVVAVVGTLVISVGRVALTPSIDGAMLKSLGSQGHKYGRLRSWGSLGYLLAALCASLLGKDGEATLGVGVVVSLLLFAITLALPAVPAGPPVRIGPALRTLGTSRSFRWLLVASALHYAPIGSYDFYFAVYVQELGLPLWAAGVAIALGVTVEVLVLWMAEPLLHRVRPETIFRFAILLGIPRWIGTAFLPWPWAIVGLQALHGLSFGAFWVAAVALLWARTPRTIQTSAQALLSAAVGGLGSLLAAEAGLILAAYGGRAMYATGACVAVLASGAAWLATRPDHNQSRTNP